MKLGFDELIDELDSKSLIKLHKELETRKYYADCDLDVSEIGTDLQQIKKAVKVGIQSPSFPELYEFAPESIRKYIEPHLKEQTPKTPDEQSNASGALELEFEQTEAENERDELLKELLSISEQRGDSGRIPPLLSDRFSEIVTLLNKKYKMPAYRIAETIDMGRQVLATRINDYVKQHPEILKLPFTEPKEHHDTSYAEKGAEKGVKQTIESELIERAKNITEKYHNLGRELYDKYEPHAINQGIELTKMAFEAMNLYLKKRETFQLLMHLESENLALRESIRSLEARNKSLTHALLSNSGY